MTAPGLAPHSLQRHDASASRSTRLAVFLLLLISLGAVVNLVRLEFGPWATEAIQVDELFFSTCAARGIAIGQIPVPGCHDNKAPVIYWAHQLVHLAAGIYNIGAMKVAAYAIVAVIAGQVMFLAGRLGGWPAAIAAPALMLLTFSGDATLFALKTETIGSVFILSGIGLWILADGTVSRRRWFVVGLFFGLATMTKQTYAVAGLALIAHRLLVAVVVRDRPALAVTVDVFCCGLGMALPMLGFVGWFALEGGWAELLGNLLIYPSIYGPASEVPVWRKIAWNCATILQILSRAPLVPVLLASAFIVRWWPVSRLKDWRAAVASPTMAVIMVIGALLLVLAIAPKFFVFHLLPVWALMSLVAALHLQEIMLKLDHLRSRASAVLTGLLVAYALVFAWSSVSTRGGRGEDFERHSDPSRWTERERQGPYAYVHGVWPYFYAYNKLIPASNVMFSWALPGAPAQYIYRRPPADTWRGRVLAWAQERAARQLEADFRQTPPSTILVVHDIARAAGSANISDVPAIDSYLKSHCAYARVLVERGLQTSVYHCRLTQSQRVVAPG